MSSEPVQDDCVFCNILIGKTQVVTVFSTPLLMAIMDAFPIRPGHLLLVPRLHVPDFFQLPERTFSDLMLTAYHVGNAMHHAFPEQKIALFFAGKAFTEHTHIHLLPLTQGLKATFANLNTLPRCRASNDELVVNAKKIMLFYDGLK